MQHTLYMVLQGTSFFPPHHQQFFKFVYSEITGESAWWVLFMPAWCCSLLWQLKIIRIGLTLIMDFWYPGPSYLVQEVLVLYICLYLVSCSQKMCWREHSLADTVPLFSTILQFSLELSKNWDTGLPCLCPLWIYSTSNSIRLLYFRVCFSSFLPSFTIVASWIVLIIRTSLVVPHLHHYVTILCNADFSFFKRLPSPTRLCGMPLWALIVPQTLTFLSSYVWANLTLL